MSRQSEQKIVATYDGRGPQSLRQLLHWLHKQQVSEWPLLAENQGALREAGIRELQCHGFSVLLQFNPKRIRSTNVMIKSDRDRKKSCFLCIANLPDEQEGILYREEYLILCNPSPIFRMHFTIAHVRHRPQAIGGSLGDLLLLARDMGPEFTVFYNGACCGASAPDHLHFQACSSSELRIVCERTKAALVAEVKGIKIFNLRGQGRGIVVLEGQDIEAMKEAFGKLAIAEGHCRSLDKELKMNALCIVSNGVERLYVFPRKRHRPEAFFAEGHRKLTISPGAIDMAGLVIMPVEEEFLRITPGEIERIYNEVALDENEAEKLIAKAFRPIGKKSDPG